MKHHLTYWLPLLALSFILASAAIFWATSTAEAQCGSQASSCKNCHEVQGKKSVNNDGKAWHKSHAFGDFCQFCHAGNVQSMDQTEAHKGMAKPLADVKLSCSSCHQKDYVEKAQVYATALGVTLTAGGGGGNQPPASSSGSGGSPAQPSSPSQPSTSSNAVTAPNVIDYGKQYDETVLGKTEINWGNVILGVMLFGLVIGGGAFVYVNEKKLSAKSQIPTSKIPISNLQSFDFAQDKSPISINDLKPEVSELLPQLQKLEPRALKALKKITCDPDAANDLLYSISRIDPHLIEEVRRLDRKEINLLMALAEEK